MAAIRAAGEHPTAVRAQDAIIPRQHQWMTPGPLGSLQVIEPQAIDVAIASRDDNAAAAARKLGVSASAVYRRLSEQAQAD